MESGVEDGSPIAFKGAIEGTGRVLVGCRGGFGTGVARQSRNDCGRVQDSGPLKQLSACRGGTHGLAIV